MSKRLAEAVAAAAELSQSLSSSVNHDKLPHYSSQSINQSTNQSNDDEAQSSDSDIDLEDVEDLDDDNQSINQSIDEPTVPNLIFDAASMQNLSPLPSSDTQRKNIISNSHNEQINQSINQSVKLPTNQRHRTTYRIDSSSTEVFSMSFSLDDRWLSLGCADGSVRILNQQGKLKHLVHCFTATQSIPLPITCTRFRPGSNSASLLAACSDGSVSQISASTGQVVSRLVESDNQIYAMDFALDGQTFATAGRDAVIRIYDESTKQLKQSLKGRPFPSFNQSINQSGHTNRIYSVKFAPISESLLISGGWDNTVLTWDLRANSVIRSVYGPHIAGDSLAWSPDETRFLTGSWRQSQALEEWDNRAIAQPNTLTHKPLRSITYNLFSEAGGRGSSEMLYAAAYSPDGRFMAAGGCGSNDAKLRQTDYPADANTPQNPWEDRIALTGGVYALAFNQSSTKLAIAGADQNIVVVDL